MTAPPFSSEPWRIWIDTGGTFTDCVALPPRPVEGGGLRRAKVLSSGALRGRVVQSIDSRTVRIEAHWQACDDLIRGFEFQPLHGGAARRVARYLAAESIIEFDEPIAAVDALTGQALFEVRSDEPAPIVAARLVTGTPAGAPLPPIVMRLATTRGTNALLERRGAPTVFFVTQGFADLLTIGDQQRPDLFALNIVRTPPLQEQVVEVRERIDATGQVLRPLDEDDLLRQARMLRARGFDVAAVALMHSYLNPEHEQRVAAVLRQIGFRQVSTSAALAPLIRLLPRAQTAVVDAFLSPVVEDYLSQVTAGMQTAPSSRLHVMTSAGGLVASSQYRACDSLLSGPAGGVAGAAAAARRSGYTRIIGLDMGGTSTDVARFDGDFDYRFEQQVGGVRLMAPALAIETVAAGGGSICEFVDGRLTVGPRSAGADPGPACYGAGGPLTLTDVNLLLGRLSADDFEVPISLTLASAAAQRLVDAVARSTSVIRAAGHAPPSMDALLSGCLDIANERMASAIEQVSIRQGYDPRDDALVAFGGAGGQHACTVAERLGIETIIMPADASLLSALGLGYSAMERITQQQVLKPLAGITAELPQIVAELARSVRADLLDEGVDPATITCRVIVNLRLLGQDSTIAVDLHEQHADGGAMASFLVQAFSQRYRAIYGHETPRDGQRPIEVESLRVIASSADPPNELLVRSDVEPDTPARDAARRAQVFFAGEWREVAVHHRRNLCPGMQLTGPLLVVDRRSTCVVEVDWEASVDEVGALVVRKRRTAPAHHVARPEPVQTELFSNRFAAVADEMGQILQRTALSTNVKERLDFSCAVLDPSGELVVNAPHIPVHLGALGMCVRQVRTKLVMQDGDVVVTNHPSYGGSHLPDITVITPVFADGRLLGYVANRAHHAEIGGVRPGSMPPAATTLAEEGVIIEPQYLVHRHRDCFDRIERLLRHSAYPSRAVPDNMADLRAAVAANHRGVQSLRALAREHGVDVVLEQMRALTARAERLTRAAFRRLGEGVYRASDRMDDGAVIAVRVEIESETALIDFAGTAGVHPGNLNATPAIVRSAVIYVLRLLIGERLPLNEGIMRAVEVRLPPGLLNPSFVDDASRCPAVVGGNTETSQRIVDVLLKALNIAACSQGTMNNVLFGDEQFGYYETIGGGCGAGPGFEGASAVHSHMTNTRITDPEIIEHRYPVRLDRFAIRRASGGQGRWNGGDGIAREITFLAPMSLSLLTQRRTPAAPPCGAERGQPGAPGRQRLFRADGSELTLASIDGCEVRAGDRLLIETPGGGAWGNRE